MLCLYHTHCPNLIGRTVENPYSELELEQRKIKPYVALNMVSSIDGKVTVGGRLTSGVLGSKQDREVMNYIRYHFDGVLVGGETCRQHPYYLGLPPELAMNRQKVKGDAQPLTIVLTRSGRFDLTAPLFSNPPRRPLIIATSDLPEVLGDQLASVAHLEVAPDTQGDPTWTASLLKQRFHINHLLIEGGPQVNYQFIKAGLVDEIFMTLAPKLVGSVTDLSLLSGDSPLSPMPKLQLLSAFKGKDELFLRYKVRRIEKES